MKYDEVKMALIEARTNMDDSCQFCDKWDEINGCDIGGCEAQFSMQTVCDTLESLINKIENGTLVELPCKIGTKIYIVGESDFCIPKYQMWEDEFCLEDIERFGDTVFLTKDEAEAKLKELRGER